MFYFPLSIIVTKEVGGQEKTQPIAGLQPFKTINISPQHLLSGLVKSIRRQYRYLTKRQYNIQSSWIAFVRRNAHKKPLISPLSFNYRDVTLFFL